MGVKTVDIFYPQMDDSISAQNVDAALRPGAFWVSYL